MQTKPVGAYANGKMLGIEDIEEAWVFDGVWPTALPYDALQSDITTADSIQLSVNFSYDGYPLRTSEGAAEACLAAYKCLNIGSLLDTYDYIVENVPHYGKDNPYIGNNYPAQG